jgi:transposase
MIMTRKTSEMDRSQGVASIAARRVRRQFDEPFKRTVVEQVERLGRSQSSVARSYELDPKMLRRWLREYGNPQRVRGLMSTDPVTGGAVVAESLAMMEMRKRLRDVEEENDILKKALGVFSRRQR